LSPIGDVQLAATSRRSQLILRYSRTVDQAFGLGRDRLADVVGASASRTLARAVQFTAGATWSWSKDPLDEAFRFTTVRYETDLRWAFARDLALDAGYLYSRNTDGASGPGSVDSHAINLGIRYARQREERR
jgi:hypothetical protein